MTAGGFVMRAAAAVAGGVVVATAVFAAVEWRLWSRPFRRDLRPYNSF